MDSDPHEDARARVGLYRFSCNPGSSLSWREKWAPAPSVMGCFPMMGVPREYPFASISEEAIVLVAEKTRETQKFLAAGQSISCARPRLFPGSVLPVDAGGETILRRSWEPHWAFSPSG